MHIFLNLIVIIFVFNFCICDLRDLSQDANKHKHTHALSLSLSLSPPFFISPFLLPCLSLFINATKRARYVSLSVRGTMTVTFSRVTVVTVKQSAYRRRRYLKQHRHLSAGPHSSHSCSCSPFNSPIKNYLIAHYRSVLPWTGHTHRCCIIYRHF